MQTIVSTCQFYNLPEGVATEITPRAALPTMLLVDTKPMIHATPERIGLVQLAKAFPSQSQPSGGNDGTAVNLGAARWGQLRTRMGRLMRGMKRCRRRSADGERELLCGASILHKDFWLEALDEQHRYGFNLRAFHKAWKHEMAEGANSSEDASFFHWLDHGKGSTLELPECSQQELRSTHVEYCTAEQRKQYELEFVSTEEGVRVHYAASGRLVHTDERSKWIFVMDLSGHMYLGRKRKGHFHHSSFVSGAPIFAAGKIIIKNGVIIAIEPHSGHFKPRLENLLSLCSMLANHNVDIDDIAFVKPKKWTCEWPFPSQPDVELEDFAGASDTDYGADKSDSEEPQTLLPEL
ncbi:unnamed protein product [Phytophthora fragariaefolia]|uniref:Unnamed protein product n=1 Tax=Phytophthora fragariaefolia TaxID=1490495 RepID=A0A9W7CYJ1_9STRA|nr:unnamed protein product [Phytophthora fragariaefolia]